MVETVTITIEEYNEYLKLKNEKNETENHVKESLQALKEGNVYDL